MKYKNTIFVITLAALSLFLAQRHGWLGGSGPSTAQAQSSDPSPVTECETLRKHGDPASTDCYQRLTASSDPLLRAEGMWGLRDYLGANDEFIAALKADESDPERRVRYGMMFLEHWQPGDAGDLFKEALDLDALNPRALLGMAKVASQGYDAEAIKYAEEALKVDPDLYEAREVMARVHLEDNDPEKAREEANKALEISGEALQALAILGTADLLEDKPADQYLQRALAVNPTYGEFWETAGYFHVINRRYDEGIDYYRRALELKPDLWSARAELGINLMRFGKDDEARQQLELCYNNGYKPQSVVNSLILMDSYENFETFTTPTTILKLHKKEADLIRPYFQQELDRAMATYEDKYQHKLDGPVQVEVYPDHEDFAVRTMGLPGLGALGVTFGQVVAMDSPSGRPPGEFHWASTLWHELSHVYVLSMTHHRVPRWFTEGLAVYEETATEPSWGDRLSPREITAIQDDKLLPIAELDRGFIHPTYPEQVVVSYFQGGRVITFIVEKWGYNAILDMIHAFAEAKDTVTVIQEVLGVTPEEFDQQFFPWLEQKTKKTLDGFDDWRETLVAMNDAAKEGDWDQVITEGNRIRDIYPDYVEAGSVYEFLARAYEAKDDPEAAREQLEAYARVGGRSPATLLKLAKLQQEAGLKTQAEDTLEGLNMIYLNEGEAHEMLGSLYMDTGQPALAAREFGAVLAGDPIDIAGGHFNLARALKAENKTDEALEELFQALEAAPSYKPAQQMLLELNAK